MSGPCSASSRAVRSRPWRPHLAHSISIISRGERIEGLSTSNRHRPRSRWRCRWCDSRQRAAHPKSRRAVAVPLANGPLFSTRQEGPRGRTMLAVVLYDCFNPAHSQGGVMDEPTAAAAKAYWLEEQKRRREQAFLGRE